MRSIPARAGEPSFAAHSAARIEVDPRARGGAVEHRRIVADAEGRSPRARGSPRGRHPRPRLGGSIPARAGEPPARAGVWNISEVDPRARGGAHSRPSCSSAVPGRSPRARGSQRMAAFADISMGSIPARAGEPTGPRDDCTRTEVDPRARGGAPAWVYYVHAERGRSPRARGSQRRKARRSEDRGSIPARAGEPLVWRAFCASERVGLSGSLA